MEIRLDRIADEPFRWKETRSVSAESLDRPQLLELGRISWEGEVARTSSGFLLTAELAYQQALQCPRCLARSPSEVKSRFDLLIQPKSKEPEVGELELERSELEILFVEGDVLDTNPILIEQIQLNIPMRLLCRQDCAGLCPQCGIDRNVDSCACDEQVVDPRWAALSAVRDRFEN